jgi:WD40 repeat protein
MGMQNFFIEQTEVI